MRDCGVEESRVVDCWRYDYNEALAGGLSLSLCFVVNWVGDYCMAVRVRRFQTTLLEQTWRRLRLSVRSMFSSGDFTALLIVFAMLLMPVLALQAAGWPLALGTVLPVLFLSTL